MPDTAERGKRIMAIFHYTVKIVGRSKGKSIISASAYLNGDVMKNEENGRISYYTSKKEVVYTSLMMCKNAPQEWQNVPVENIKRFQKSVRYKRADNKVVALDMGILFLIMGLLIIGIGYLVGKIYRKYCWDIISIMVAIMSTAIVIYFGEWIKAVIPINLIVLLLLVHVVYIGIRCYVKDWREERGYY